MKPGVDTISSCDAVKPQLATKKTTKNMIIRSVSVGLKRAAAMRPAGAAAAASQGTLILRLYRSTYGTVVERETY